VRERSAVPARRQTYSDRLNGPAHPKNDIVAQLNATWRVVDDPLQWVLQRTKGNPRSPYECLSTWGLKAIPQALKFGLAILELVRLIDLLARMQGVIHQISEIRAWKGKRIGGHLV